MKGWYPKYKTLLEKEDRQGICRNRIFWYYTTTSDYIDVLNGGYRSPDAIIHPGHTLPEHFNFAVRLPLRELISAVEKFAKPYGGVGKVAASKRPPYYEDKAHGKAGILMPITQVWRTPEHVLRASRESEKEKADDLLNMIIGIHLNAFEDAVKEGNHDKASFHRTMIDLLLPGRENVEHINRDGIPSALEAPANARLLIDVARREERSRYDVDIASGRRDLQEQMAHNGGRDVNAEMMKAHGWRDFDPGRDRD